MVQIFVFYVVFSEYEMQASLLVLTVKLCLWFREAIKQSQTWDIRPLPSEPPPPPKGVDLGLWNVAYILNSRKKMLKKEKNQALWYIRPDKGGDFKSCLRVLKLCVWLLMGWGRCLKATLQKCAPQISAGVDGVPNEDPHLFQWKFPQFYICAMYTN